MILAQDSRLGYSLDTPACIRIEENERVEAVLTDNAEVPCLVQVKVPLENGGSMTLIDYASAGKLWSEESKLAAWIRQC